MSSIMLLVISTKGCHLHTWGEETITHILLAQNFTRDALPRKNLIFAQVHKIAKGLLLQYSCAALKSICVHLDPRSQLVCVLTQTLVIMTTFRIFVANLRVKLVHAP